MFSYEFVFIFIHSYEERNRSLDSVSSRYKESTTFEDFANRIYNPMPISSYTTLRDTSNNSAPLAAALIDHQRSSVKGKEFCRI